MSQGFTLVELTVSVGIILALSGFMFANYKFGNKQVTLKMQAYQFSQSLRSAQEMAMSVKELSDSAIPGGYGIYIKVNEQSYLRFADLNNNGVYDAGEALETVALPSKIKIKSIISHASYNNGNPVSETEASVAYIPPEPSSKIVNASAVEVNDAAISFVYLDEPEKAWTVVLNRAGLIYVE